MHCVEEYRHILQTLDEEGNGFESLDDVVATVQVLTQLDQRSEDVEERFLDRLDYALLVAVVKVQPQQLVHEF